MSVVTLTSAGAAQAAPASPFPYHGRFAPSPTGPLHFGSLIAALGSFLCARQANGEWLLRIEDIDPPREVAGSADAILHALERHGLEWDGSVLYQSGRSDAYDAALERLRDDGWLYECSCTRSEIASHGRRGPYGIIYPGTCRTGARSSRRPRSLRVRTHEHLIHFDDLLQGLQQQRLQETSGDFIVRRADGLYAYQLAVVVDDDEQNITDVVRGADLLDSTPRQIHLQQLLSLRNPRYLHLPIAANSRGEKLSKQTHAPALEQRTPSENLWRALTFLDQKPPPDLLHATPRETLTWAIEAWNVKHVPHRGIIRLED
ncbi:MAG: tRNA glutamyl-Q(34) synthetase GluQRS [Acidihalobacter sp.]|uniref:tRNA glutamyl-Q(34) synthetase GluQRS n=1 Tax=Acidihalobacter sp. TaxID=1872108 RepID=UPI00307EC9E8